jgi:nitroreductase
MYFVAIPRFRVRPYQNSIAKLQNCYWVFRSIRDVGPVSVLKEAKPAKKIYLLMQIHAFRSILICMTVTEALHNRRAIPFYDTSVSISLEEVDRLIETASLSPSSMNLQPWKFLVVTTAEAKAKLQSVSYNQAKISEASAVVVVVADLNFHQNAEAIADGAVARGYFPADKKQGFLDMAHGGFSDPEARRVEAIRSSSLFAMSFMLVAKEAGWDTSPMGGFDPEGILREFNIAPGHLPVIEICIGKAKPDFELAARNVRFSTSETVHVNSW